MILGTLTPLILIFQEERGRCLFCIENGASFKLDVLTQHIHTFKFIRSLFETLFYPCSVGFFNMYR